MLAFLGRFRSRPADGGPPPPAEPDDGSVREPDNRDQAWIDLAAELTPAKSLIRIDTATTRVMSTVTVLGTLITGFGLYTAGFTAAPEAARWFALAATLSGILAVMSAFAGQLLSVTRGLNTADLLQVQQWYTRRFRIRVPLARLGTAFLIIAACLVGTAAAIVSVGRSADPQMSITRIRQSGNTPAYTVTVEATFRGLTPTDHATITVTVGTVMVAAASFMPGTDGVATRSITVDKIGANELVSIVARGGPHVCTSALRPGSEPIQVDCR